MIAVDGLTKRYGSKLAVDSLSFRVEAGEVVGFLGPNGAGKTTTLRILAGFLGASSGHVTVAGVDMWAGSYEARRNVGYMPEAVPLYPEMRVAEYLRFRAELKGVSRSERATAIDSAMGQAHVLDVAHVLIGHLSKGYRQRVGLADVLVAKPPLLILDEPTAGLDPNQIREVRSVIRDLGRSHTVLLSTHILSEVEATCTRALVIHRGKLVASGTLAEVAAQRGAAPTLFVVRGERTTALAAFGIGCTSIEVEEVQGDILALRVQFASRDVADATERAVASLVKAGCSVRQVCPASSVLEDVFASLTSESASNEPSARARDDTKRNEPPEVLS